MDPLKRRGLVFIFLGCVFLFVFINFLAANHLYSCGGFADFSHVPTEFQLAKIQEARKLFTKQPETEEPDFFIRTGPCYNAWADAKKHQIIISQQIMANFSVEELAGVLGHEYAHLIIYEQKILSNEDALKQHWKVDLWGAKLTSKEVMLKTNKKQIAVHTSFFDDDSWYRYFLPIPYRASKIIIKDFEDRNYKLIVALN